VGLGELLEILVRNWCNDGPMHELKGIVGLAQEWTEDGLLQLRAAGISTGMIAVDGKVWAAPALGQTTAGTPMSATRDADAVMRALQDLREHLDERLHEAARAVESAGRHTAGDWEPCVIERVAGLLLDGSYLLAIARLS